MPVAAPSSPLPGGEGSQLLQELEHLLAGGQEQAWTPNRLGSHIVDLEEALGRLMQPGRTADIGSLPEHIQEMRQLLEQQVGPIQGPRMLEAKRVARGGDVSQAGVSPSPGTPMTPNSLAEAIAQALERERGLPSGSSQHPEMERLLEGIARHKARLFNQMDFDEAQQLLRRVLGQRGLVS